MTDSPILVSGTPRAGTTWMQWLLSSHPRIHIHGQEPELQITWQNLLAWYKQLVCAGVWSAHANQTVNYRIPHYAGSNPERCRTVFARMAKDFLCGYGPERPRWGQKCLWLCAREGCVQTIQEVWPCVKWVICLRHPWVSFESQKNTFGAHLSAETWTANWIATAKFLDHHEGFLFQIDKLNHASPIQRQETIDRLLEFLGESPTPETRKFVADWPRIHKEREDSARTFRMAEQRKSEMHQRFPELRTYMERLGYK